MEKENAPLPSNPLVSIIVPNYNYSRYLKERLDSILNQTFQDFELIILDDCSTDDSRQLIEAYRNHPKVSHVVFNRQNTGRPFVQWEKGLQLARGKYAWIAEADDSAEPTFLEKTVAAIVSDPEVTMVKTMSQHIDAEGKPSSRKYFEPYRPDGKTYIYDGNQFINTRMLLANNCYNASMMLFSIEKWRSLSDRIYMNMRYAGDWIFWGYMMQDAHIGEVRQRLNKFRFHGHSVTDEGVHTMKAGISAQAEAETTCVRLRLQKVVEEAGMPEPKSQKWIRQYYQHKYIRDPKNENLRQELLKLDGDSLRTLSQEKINYPWLWIYKHWFWKRPKDNGTEGKSVSEDLTPLKILGD